MIDPLLHSPIHNSLAYFPKTTQPKDTIANKLHFDICSYGSSVTFLSDFDTFVNLVKLPYFLGKLSNFSAGSTLQAATLHLWSIFHAFIKSISVLTASKNPIPFYTKVLNTRRTRRVN